MPLLSRRGNCRISDVDRLISRFTINRYRWYFRRTWDVARNCCRLEDIPLRGCPWLPSNLTGNQVQATVTADRDDLLDGLRLTIRRSYHDRPGNFLGLNRILLIVANNHDDDLAVLFLDLNLGWNRVWIYRYPVFWKLRRYLDRVTNMAGDHLLADLVAIAVDVLDQNRPLISRVGDINRLVLLTILNRYRWYISWGSRVTGDLAWLEVHPGTFGPVTVSYVTSNVIDRGVTVDLRYLLRRGRLTIWRRHVDCPRDCLVQVTLVSPLDFLTRWRLIARLNWLSVVNAGRIMLNRDLRVWGSFTRKVNHFWNLAIDDLPTSWNIGFNINSLSCLTIDRICLDLVAILVNIDNISGLIFRLID